MCGFLTFRLTFGREAKGRMKGFPLAEGQRRPAAARCERSRGRGNEDWKHHPCLQKSRDRKD